VNYFALLTLIFFAFKISIEDLQTYRIRNRKLFIFFVLLLASSLISGNVVSQISTGIIFFVILTLLHVIGLILPIHLGMGFGDVKLITVIAFGFIDTGLRSLEIFFLSLCIAFFVQMSLHFLHQRKIPSRMAMAPSIFLAIGLYLYAPIRLLLPQ
jgi:Flp pilus assembly protein protease CpaA